MLIDSITDRAIMEENPSYYTCPHCDQKILLVMGFDLHKPHPCPECGVYIYLSGNGVLLI